MLPVICSGEGSGPLRTEKRLNSTLSCWIVLLFKDQKCEDFPNRVRREGTLQRSEPTAALVDKVYQISSMQADVAVCQTLFAENGSDYSNNHGYDGLSSMQGNIAGPS